MPFDWKQYVELSAFLQQLANHGSIQEAMLRCALSRAYYGAFCYARNYARDCLGFEPRSDGEDHGRLREHLKKSKRWLVSEKLERLRDWRNECDYEDQLSFDAQSALGAALGEAHYVFAGLPPVDTSSLGEP
jgi:hypothetical protein